MKVITLKRRPKIWCYTIFFILCSFTALVYYFLLARQLDTVSNPWARDKPPFAKLLHASNSRNEEVSERLAALEAGLKENGQTLNYVRQKVIQVSNAIYDESIEHGREINDQCNNAQSERGHADVCVRDMYKEIPFDDQNGGVWTQGWDVKVNNSRLGVNGRLKVFVVPHSHNDPGWVKTFEQYFTGHTRHILNNALNFLDSHPNMKFIWAETSYFAHWWGTISKNEQKELVKRLIKNGQLEIVTGGWVMNDEANSHYFSIISQLVEGHEWLRNNLGEEIGNQVKHGWAIDPFGMSSTMAFVLKKMGLQGMVIQRVHYSMKKYLAQHQLLEFKWRQYWEGEPKINDLSINGDIVAHTMPFYSYDVPHSCGPDPKVCCQFDFRRMPPFKLNCPWKVNPRKISDTNVEERATLLLDQYRKKAMIYRTNSVLIPLGDDFRYEKIQEWENQYSNYQLLFDYMNSRPDWNVEVKFATLSDYFNSFKNSVSLPSLTGDFFTYADRVDHYWSGYYTTRPFYKRFDRILQSYLRTAEILYTFSSILRLEFNEDSIKDQLEYSRQNLALFQHHDAITGTARESVVLDYALRMHKSLTNCQNIISKLTEKILSPASKVEVLEIFPDERSNSRQKMISLNSGVSKWSLIVFNSLGFEREEYLCFEIDIKLSNWILKDSNGAVIQVQLNYLWNENSLITDRIEACFMKKLAALSYSTFTIEINSSTQSSQDVSSVELYGFEPNLKFDNHLIRTQNDVPTEFVVQNDRVKLVFSGVDGMLHRIIELDENGQDSTIKSHEMKLSFMTFSTTPNKKDHRSGAYLFLPDKPEAQELGQSKPKIRVTRGPLNSKVEILIESPVKIRHQVSLVTHSKTIDVENEFHLVKGTFGNRELLLRVETEVQNQEIFYTDLNGLQMSERKRYPKIPLQGNVYPVPTLMYIQDSTSRFSVITGQPLGGTSPKSGIVDIFMDRKLLQDDNRGLGQAVTDNKRTKLPFKLLFESTPREPLKPSKVVQLESLALNNPIVKIESEWAKFSDRSFLKSLNTQFPCDLHLVNFRTSNFENPKEQVYMMTLHRYATSCDTSNCTKSSFKLSETFHEDIISQLDNKMKQVSLSYFQKFGDFSIDDHLKIKPMDLVAYALRHR